MKIRLIEYDNSLRFFLEWEREKLTFNNLSKKYVFLLKRSTHQVYSWLEIAQKNAGLSRSILGDFWYTGMMAKRVIFDHLNSL